MSTFMDLTKQELLDAVDYFSVDGVKPSQSKQAIADALAEDGITIEQYNKFFGKPEQEDLEGEPLPEQASKTVDLTDAILIKMERRNPTFELRGYVFSSAHPFHLVSEEDANWILENERGFRIASPKEAKEYYG
jgi:hypothetical protein